jgi:hypothetical protein
MQKPKSALEPGVSHWSVGRGLNLCLFGFACGPIGPLEENSGRMLHTFVWFTFVIVDMVLGCGIGGFFFQWWRVWR